jgi:hypothetical protein
MPTDFAGNDIHVGNTIAYAFRRGSVLKLKKAVILGIENNGGEIVLVGYDPTAIAQRRVRIKNVKNCIVIGR